MGTTAVRTGAALVEVALCRCVLGWRGAGKRAGGYGFRIPAAGPALIPRERRPGPGSGGRQSACAHGSHAPRAPGVAAGAGSASGSGLVLALVSPEARPGDRRRSLRAGAPGWCGASWPVLLLVPGTF